MIFKFLMVFLPLGFVAKILGEVVHEVMGHGLFVVAFGGRITNINISLLWPYKLSGIGFSHPPGGFQPWQEILVDGGGIIICLAVSFIVQLILLLSFSKRGNWVVSSMLFWLAFSSPYINSCTADLKNFLKTSFYHSICITKGMFARKKKCTLCKQPIEKGKEIREEVEVYGLVGKFKRSFCCDKHLEIYKKRTEELMKTRSPRICKSCLK